MCRVDCIRRLVMIGAVVLVPAALFAVDRKPPTAEFRAAKRTFQQKFRSRKADDRVAAVRKLQESPDPEAAELVWQLVLGDDSAEVRKSGVDLLIHWRDQPEISGRLVELLNRNARKTGIDERACGALRALAGTEDADLQGQVLHYLDEVLGTPKGDQRRVHTLIDDLGKQADAEALRALTLFSRAKFFGKNFGYRRCVIQGVVQVPGNETLTFLIDLLPDLTGLVQHDVILHLIRVTGQNFRDDAAGWKAWWVQQGKKLSEKVDPLLAGPPGAGGAYYGIPIGAKRVVFALDVSGSMDRGGKFEAAQRELCDAIQGLPENVLFDIVTFNRQVQVWQPELIPAHERSKRLATQMVMSQTTKAGTASFDALEAAFALDPEAIYFVSDGEPRGGKIEDPDAIVTAISKTNHVRRVSVHAIGVGTNDPNAGRLAKFMRALADADWGEYRAVDQK